MRVAFDLSAAWGAFQLAAQAEIELTGVTAIFGPSGSGKTTLLKAIAGFAPGLGRVTIAEHIWQGAGRTVPAHRRPVGYVFQDGRLFEHLSVAGNLDYAAKRASAAGPEIARDAVIAEMDLAPLLPRRPATLSGGERQRVAIARALLTRPQLLLMDEPLAALDRARKAPILRMISALPRRFGTPVLFVSHQLDEIVQIADRLLAVQAGRIIGEGPTAEMLDTMDPEITGRFEAGALLEGRVAEIRPQSAMLGVDIGGALLWIPDVGGLSQGDPVRVRVRSRDVSLALAPVDGLSIRNQIPGVITAVLTDESAFAEVRLTAAGQMLRARVSRMAVEDLGLIPGQAVTALIKSIAFDRRLLAR
ncbi:MAG: molybdenum ABC transporter ATP-binding protein [Pseudomonadota bacterium]